MSGWQELIERRERQQREIDREKNIHRDLHDYFWGRKCNSDRTKTKPPTSSTNETEQ